MLYHSVVGSLWSKACRAVKSSVVFFFRFIDPPAVPTPPSLPKVAVASKNNFDVIDFFMLMFSAHSRVLARHVNEESQQEHISTDRPKAEPTTS